MKASQLFSNQEQSKIVEAIVQAEENTSAEIRLHIENRCQTDPLIRGRELFCLLGMEQTKCKNGVLIYIAIKDRKLAIIADTAIDQKVNDTFWDYCYQQMATTFKSGHFTEGIIATLLLLEAELSNSFPIEKGDVNELSDAISFGKDENE